MASDMMTLDQLASYLQRDARELHKLANRGHLPGHKVSGDWRFARAEIDHWIETQLPTFTDQQLTAVETQGAVDPDQQPLVTKFLTPATIAVPLPATTRSSVLRELVRLAEQSWEVYDPDAILEAVRLREEMATTALPGGVALPHPRRPQATALGESVIAFGRTTTGLPFGAPRGEPTDLFFLVLCRDSRTHLKVLARLTRLLNRPGFTDALRAAETPGDVWAMLQETENELIATSA